MPASEGALPAADAAPAPSLAEVAERLQLALSASDTALWDADVRRGDILLDERWSLMLGGAPRATRLPWRELAQLIHPDDRGRAARRQREIILGTAPEYQDDYRVRAHTGEWIWVHSRGRVVRRDADGRALRMIGTNTDISARKRAESALQAEKEFLSSLQRITLELLAQRQMPDLLLTILDRATTLLRASHGQVALKEGDAMFVRARTAGMPVLSANHVARSGCIVWQAHDTRRPAVVHEPRDRASALAAFGHLPVQSAAAIPVLLAGECLGVLMLGRAEAGTPFTADDIDRAEHFAQMASLVLHNARLREAALAEAAANTQALRESEEKFRSVFDKSPIPIALATMPDGRIVEANPAALAMFAQLDRSFEGRSSVELGIWREPADRERFSQILRQRGAVTGFEVAMRTRAGEELEALLSGSILTIGGKAHSLVSLLDITERKRAEARFRDLFEFAPDAILLTARDGRICDANQRALELFACAREELLARPLEELMAESARLAWRDRLAEYLAKPAPQPMGSAGATLAGLAKNGRTFALDLGLSPLRTGTVELVVVALRDVTEQQRAAEQQRGLEQQLRQAQKMEALGTLAGGIAHDFNNLLTAILGHSELALSDLPSDHPVRPSLVAVRQAGLRSRDLVKQILTFSRRMETERLPLLLQDVVEDSFKLLRSTIPTMVQMEHAIDPACPAICGDASQIQQVLMNLCTNAWHALPAHGGRIELRLAACELLADSPLRQRANLPTGRYAQLTVSDNGHGMDSATLDRIYDPFFTTKPVGQGTGLGLSMVHGIVQAHQGGIAVRSERGRGTRFDVFLPALQTRAAPHQATADEVSRGRGERILYVDDDELAGETVAAMLAHLGYTVEPLLQPLSALERFRAAPERYDLVVTDLAMPHMTGTELAAHIHRIRPDLPVLLITGYMDPVRDDELRLLGIREVLRKPFAGQTLASAVRRALD